MEITKEKVVSITYELRKDKKDGEVVEQVTTENPLTFVYGIGHMLPKFEEYLSGLTSGKAFEFGLNSEDAYGPVVDNAIVDVPVDVFKVDGEIDNNILKVGSMVPMMDNSGNRLNGMILEIGETVKMDFNHPMAGKDLFFKGEVCEVRDATPEELSQGLNQGGSCCGDGNCEDGSCDDTEKGSCDDTGSCGCGGH